MRKEKISKRERQILELLSVKPDYGSNIAKKLRMNVDGFAVYRKRLEEKNYITSSPNVSIVQYRRYFEITDTGLKDLAETPSKAQIVEDIFEDSQLSLYRETMSVTPIVEIVKHRKGLLISIAWDAFDGTTIHMIYCREFHVETIGE